MIREPLWPNGAKLEVIGVTGRYSSGKTLFGLTIAPAETICFDLEKGCGCYESLGFKRIDVSEKLQERFPDGATPQQTFESWLAMMRSIKVGQYSVIVVDPIDDLENGLVELVSNDFASHGRSSREAFERTKGIYWAAVKNRWKAVLSEVASRCQTFVFTTHLRRVWIRGEPTEEFEPRGKASLMEMSSLYLFLERDPGSPPSGIVLKSKLAGTAIVNGEVTIVDKLPPRMPLATPTGIRHYIVYPCDHKNLKDEEKAPEKPAQEDPVLRAARLTAERTGGGPALNKQEATQMEAEATEAGIAAKVLEAITIVLLRRNVECLEGESFVSRAQQLTRPEFVKFMSKIQSHKEVP